MPNAVVDLFCGIGGLTHGLQLSGLNVVAGVDIEESCRYAYEENNNAIFVKKDIKELDAQTVLDFYPENCVKILVGCAPCQPFSKYSSRYRKNGHNDEKWRLLYYFQNIVSNVLPDIISVENVPNLKNEKVFLDFINELKRMNYYYSWSVVNCQDYGVPQRRRRLVLLASQYGNINLIPPLYNQDNYRTVRMAIENLPPIHDGESDQRDPLHCASRLSFINRERIRQSVPGGTWRDWDERLILKCHKKNTGKTYPSVYGRMMWDEPSPTITTQFYGYGNGRFGHPEQDRALSLREGALLQSFPRDYAFVSGNNIVNKHDLAVQIGNAVPVELGRAIGISIINHLNEYNVDF